MRAIPIARLFPLKGFVPLSSHPSALLFFCLGKNFEHIIIHYPLSIIHYVMVRAIPIARLFPFKGFAPLISHPSSLLIFFQRKERKGNREVEGGRASALYSFELREESAWNAEQE